MASDPYGDNVRPRLTFNEFNKEQSVNLSAPTQLIFLLTLVIAILGVLAGLGMVNFIPLAAIWIVTIAYAILAVACLLRGA